MSKLIPINVIKSQSQPIKTLKGKIYAIPNSSDSPKSVYLFQYCHDGKVSNCGSFKSFSVDDDAGDG